MGTDGTEKYFRDETVKKKGSWSARMALHGGWWGVFMDDMGEGEI